MANSAGEPLLVARDLFKAYTQGSNVEQVLNGVSLEVADQQTYAIARQSTRLRWLVCFELRGQDEVE